MGQCQYVDDSANFLDGWHCKILRGHVDDRSLVENYCKFSTRCQYCPIRGGDDRDRKSAPEPEEKPRRNDEEIHVRRSGGGDIVGGGSGGGGGLIGGFFSELGTLLKILAVAVVIMIVWMVVSKLFGFSGPWVNMQIPAGAVTEDSGLYAVNRDTAWGDALFDVASEEFDSDGAVHLRSYHNYSDVYFYQDSGAVWVGTTDLYSMNTAVVYDLTYEEICQQLYRVLLVKLRDQDGAPVLSVLTVTDESGQNLRCVNMGNETCAVLMPNEMENATLTFAAEGYKSHTASMDLSQRLSSAVVTLLKEGGGEE